MCTRQAGNRQVPSSIWRPVQYSYFSDRLSGKYDITPKE
jgi:hypothetical protein